MDYMGNSKFWDEQFKKRTGDSLPPEESLVENLKLLSPGTCIDIASGDGRNALYLAEHGFTVTAVDHSTAALQRLTKLASQKKLTIHTHPADLGGELQSEESPIEPDPLSKFPAYNTIIINHYRPNGGLLKHIGTHLAPEGTIFLCGFTEYYDADGRISPKDLISAEDLETLYNQFPQGRLLLRKNTDNKRGKLISLIIKKNLIDNRLKSLSKNR